MKKIFAGIVITLFSISSPLSTAQMTSVPSPVTAVASVTAVAPAASAVSADLEQAGVFAAVGGKVEIKASDQSVRSAVSGQPVFLHEEISTDGQGRLQILFLDQTVFTIGPNSRIVIDEFVYNPKTRDGKIVASIPKGIFRYISGKIAAKKASNVTVQLPTATIGFRGTMVGGEVRSNNSALVALLGPGSNNDAGERSGSFVIGGTGGNAGNSREVNRSGFGVEAGPDGTLSGVFQLSDAQISGLTAGLSPSASEGGAGDGAVGDTSGETNATTGQNVGSMEGMTTLLDNNNDASTTAAQYAASSSAVADGVTTIEQLSRIATGQYHYSGSGTFVDNLNYSGPMNVDINIDFGARTIGGGGSSVSFSTPMIGNKQTNIGIHSFSEVTGNAVFTDIFVSPASGETFNTQIKLMNSGGVIANNASVHEQYSGSPYTGSGVVDAPRASGAV